MNDLIAELNAAVRGPVMIALLAGTGIYLSIRTGFPQVRRFRYIMRNTAGSLLRREKEEKGNNISPFQAVATALAGTVGTGNIAGVAGAVFIGGPGAVFWMWLTAFFGMCTKYAEIALAMKYRKRDGEGVYRGGPMYYITGGLGKSWRWLAAVFAVLGALASFGIGNLAQSSEIAGACASLFGMRPMATGLILAALVTVVLAGGVKRIGQITALLVPVMSGFYLLAGLAVILLRLNDVPSALVSIFREAFSLKAAGGGAVGCVIVNAMRQGVSRGVFSNEAGLGSAPIAHAASSTQNPVDQALWGVFEVFFDTIVICTITALTLLLSGFELGSEALAAYPSQGAAAAAAFNAVLPGQAGGFIIQVSLLFFALSTILSWSYYGECCLGYLTRENRTFRLAYRTVFIFLCIAGATGSGRLMWEIADTLNILMAVPNLAALLGLSGIVVKMTRDYFGDPRRKLR